MWEPALFQASDCTRLHVPTANERERSEADIWIGVPSRLLAVRFARMGRLSDAMSSSSSR